MTPLQNHFGVAANVLGASLAFLGVNSPLLTVANPMRVIGDAPASTGKPFPLGNVTAATSTLNPLIERIRRFASLASDWDGPGSVRPTDGTVAAAIEFVKTIPSRVAPPHAVAAGDGEISLSWRSDIHFVDISVGGGSISAFAHVEGAPFKVRSVSRFSDLPAIVTQAISEA